MPIITLGTKWSISIDWTSGVGCNEFGYPTAPNNPLKTIVQSMGAYTDDHDMQSDQMKFLEDRNLSNNVLTFVNNRSHQDATLESLLHSTDG